eukprot:gene12934-8790_t
MGWNVLMPWTPPLSTGEKDTKNKNTHAHPRKGGRRLLDVSALPCYLVCGFHFPHIYAGIYLAPFLFLPFLIYYFSSYGVGEPNALPEGRKFSLWAAVHYRGTLFLANTPASLSERLTAFRRRHADALERHAAASPSSTLPTAAACPSAATSPLPASTPPRAVREPNTAAGCTGRELLGPTPGPERDAPLHTPRSMQASSLEAPAARYSSPWEDCMEAVPLSLRQALMDLDAADSFEALVRRMAAALAAHKALLREMDVELQQACNTLTIQLPPESFTPPAPPSRNLNRVRLAYTPHVVYEGSAEGRHQEGPLTSRGGPVPALRRDDLAADRQRPNANPPHNAVPDECSRWFRLPSPAPLSARRARNALPRAPPALLLSRPLAPKPAARRGTVEPPGNRRGGAVARGPTRRPCERVQTRGICGVMTVSTDHATAPCQLDGAAHLELRTGCTFTGELRGIAPRVPLQLSHYTTGRLQRVSCSSTRQEVAVWVCRDGPSSGRRGDGGASEALGRLKEATQDGGYVGELDGALRPHGWGMRWREKRSSTPFNAAASVSYFGPFEGGVEASCGLACLEGWTADSPPSAGRHTNAWVYVGEVHRGRMEGHGVLWFRPVAEPTPGARKSQSGSGGGLLGRAPATAGEHVYRGCFEGGEMHGAGMLWFGTGETWAVEMLHGEPQHWEARSCMEA